MKPLKVRLEDAIYGLNQLLEHHDADVIELIGPAAWSCALAMEPKMEKSAESLESLKIEMYGGLTKASVIVGYADSFHFLTPDAIRRRAEDKRFEAVLLGRMLSRDWFAIFDQESICA